ncbi:MAG: hydrogenase maturation nickel metallochaperone HypA [Syntrophomonadaceae bacterium]
MHELSLMTSVIETVRQGALDNNIARVKKVKLVIGKLSQALPDSLQFAFSVLSADEMFCDAVLEIEEKEIACLCPDCQTQFTVQDEYSFICPNCQGLKVDIISGRELFIDYFEGD